MMFATLDDVEGQIEMLVFKADEAASAAVIAADAWSSSAAGSTTRSAARRSWSSHEAERFEPGRDEIARAAGPRQRAGPQGR